MGEVIHWDPTVNAGTLISVALFLSVLFKLHGDIVRQLTALNVKVETMWAIYMNQRGRDRSARGE